MDVRATYVDVRATVWLDQTALNDDYYFKRYWLMSDVSDLKNIRAGIFDFEIAENKIVERRRFCSKKQSNHRRDFNFRSARTCGRAAICEF